MLYHLLLRTIPLIHHTISFLPHQYHLVPAHAPISPSLIQLDMPHDSICSAFMTIAPINPFKAGTVLFIFVPTMSTYCVTQNRGLFNMHKLIENDGLHIYVSYYSASSFLLSQCLSKRMAGNWHVEDTK